MDVPGCIGRASNGEQLRKCAGDGFAGAFACLLGGRHGPCPLSGQQAEVLGIGHRRLLAMERDGPGRRPTDRPDQVRCVQKLLLQKPGESPAADQQAPFPAVLQFNWLDSSDQAHQPGQLHGGRLIKRAFLGTSFGLDSSQLYTLPAISKVGAEFAFNPRASAFGRC